MRRLGYDRYVAQGGDVGAGVTDAMGRLAPEGLAGIHTNLLVPALNDPVALPADREQEQAALGAIKKFSTTGNGYFIEQSTRPQTIGYALLDSPVALAAWMLDHDTDAYYKISRAFVDGEPVGNLTRDHVLDNVTLYWLTGTGASAARSYWEAYGADAPGVGSGRSDPARGHRSRRLQHVPRRDLEDPAQLGREVLPDAQLLQRGRPGWPLRRLGGARTVRDRGAGRVPRAAQVPDPPAPRLNPGEEDGVSVQPRDEAATPQRRPAPLQELLARLLGRRETAVFVPSADPTLIAFAELFADSGLTAFTATKQARVDALTLVYDCWTESTRVSGTPTGDLLRRLVAGPPGTRSADRALAPGRTRRSSGLLDGGQRRYQVCHGRAPAPGHQPVRPSLGRAGLPAAGGPRHRRHRRRLPLPGPRPGRADMSRRRGWG